MRCAMGGMAILSSAFASHNELVKISHDTTKSPQQYVAIYGILALHIR